MNSKFDIKKLTEYAIQKIIKFSEEHSNETFYGFSLDANLLCLNSIEQFEKTILRYQKKWKGYNETKKIKNVKMNTGDWKYFGFAKFKNENGFDYQEYLEHYHEDEENQLTSNYAKAMNKVIENLKSSSAFDKLKTTDDFFINRTEHEY